MSGDRESDVETPPREARYDEFVTLLARHDQSVRRFIRSLLPTSEGVDDVMQETALECWRKFDGFRPETAENAVGEFIRWACVIARYKVLSWQRDHGRDRLVFREGIVERLAAAGLESIEHRDQERRVVESCLGKLPDDQRRLVLSVHTPGESVARIAAETGERARRLYSRLNVLRKRLLECVRDNLASEVEHA